MLTASKRRKDKTNRFIKKSCTRETDKLTYILSRNKEIIGECTDKRKRKPKFDGNIKRMKLSTVTEQIVEFFENVSKVIRELMKWISCYEMSTLEYTRRRLR